MSTFYLILLIVGSMTLSRKIGELTISVKQGNKEKIKVDLFFLLLAMAVIIILILFYRSTR
ncbi:MAG: hypothetical protein HYU70_16245 [Bacteroidetes bacterium]|nr:hypothetical protein [Bacteroidota bacterium]